MATVNDHDDFGGLHRDLRATGAAIDRRQLFRMAARLGVGIGSVQLLACANSPTTPGATDTTPLTSAGSSGACASRIPEETQGPYPGDGSNGPNVLTLSGVVRNDIRSSFAGLSGVADGVPLTVTLTLVSASTCAPLGGAAVYIWHCDRLGRYSLYSSGVTNQNYLRGVAEADANGQLSFTTIYPGCYSGRWPHIHFEVYSSLAKATTIANKVATSQIALQKSASDAVYATAGYESSASNASRITLASDNVFSDGASLELPTMSGSVAAGLTATLTVGI